MNSFPGEGKHLGNNIPLSQGNLEQERATAKRKEENETSGNKVTLQVFTYNSPLLALTEFKINFYDLMLIVVNMPKMNGFEFSEKILE